MTALPSTGTSPVTKVSEDELLAEFTDIMHEWGLAAGDLCEPLRYPTRAECQRRMLTSCRYCQHGVTLRLEPSQPS
jgi:hypothetical protein